MTNKTRLLNQAIAIIMFFSTFHTNSSEAAVNKVDLEAGFYTLTAKSSTTSGRVSSFGIYRIGYRRSIHPRVDIGLGYTIMFTKVVTGDTGFGLDVNGTYYFLGASGAVEAQGPHTFVTYAEDFRPYISLNFAQRNYQSIQTSYAGFGGSLGVEKNLGEKLNAKIAGRYNMLSAGTGVTANEISIFGGIVIEF